MLILDEFVGQLLHDKSTSEVLLEKGDAWVCALPEDSAGADRIRRCYSALRDLILRGPAPAQRMARAGVLYLLHSGSSAELLSELGLHAHAFVLGVLEHRARYADKGRFSPPILKLQDQQRADAIFRDILQRPLFPDEELIKQARQFCDDPGLPTQAVFFKRLLRNTAFLITVLESEDATPEEKIYARASLGYLLLEEDSISDTLGLIGYIDDAYILDAAVSAIEPSRQGWIDLIESVSWSWPLLSTATIQQGTEDPIPLSREILTNAALISEPLVQTTSALQDALFIPTSGSTTLLLGVAAGLGMLNQLSENDNRNSTIPQLVQQHQLRPASESQLIVIVGQIGHMLTLCKAIQWNDASLISLFPLATCDEDGVLTGSDQPVLVIAPSMTSAENLRARQGPRVRSILIDLLVATGGIVENETKKPTGSNPSAKRHNPLLTKDVGTRRLTAKEEIELSKKMLNARENIQKTILEIGEPVTSLISAKGVDLSALQPLMKERAESAGEELQRLNREMLRFLSEQDLSEDMLSEVVNQLRRNPTVDRETIKQLDDGIKEIDNIVQYLVQANLRLVFWMAKKYEKNGNMSADIIQEGSIGLMRAARRFDHRKEARFGTYASWWVRQGIERYLSRHSRTIRIPVRTLNDMRNIHRADQSLTLSLKRPPTLEELAEFCNRSVDQVKRLKQVSHDLEHGCVGLDIQIGREPGTSLLDVIADDDALHPIDEIANTQIAGEVHRLLQELTPFEADVLRLRFGLGERDPQTLSQIGSQMGLTRERIRQIQLKALGKLRFRAKRLGVFP